MKTTHAWFAGIILATLSAPVWSQTAAWDTLGPDNSYNTRRGYNLGQITPQSNYVDADLFRPAVSGTLASATSVLTFFGAGTVTLAIAANNNGTPGAILDSVQLSVAAPISGFFSVRFYTGSFIGGVQLSSSSSYWYEVSASVSDGGVQQFSGTDAVGSAIAGTHEFSGASFLPPGVWYADTTDGLSAGRVMVNALAVPEPDTWALMLLGCAAALVTARRRTIRPS